MSGFAKQVVDDSVFWYKSNTITVVVTEKHMTTECT